MTKVERLQKGPLRPLLWVGAKLYSLVTRLRNIGFDLNLLKRYRSSLPVVSIGNLTAGGNGKTPLALAVAEGLTERGYRPVILSRGYGGGVEGPYLVSRDDTSDRVGDEPCMMARWGFPIVIARKRVEGAKLIEEESLGDLIILDDGFQHRALDRTVDILSVDVGSQGAVDRFLAGEVLPLGLFREERTFALSRPDAVLLSERSLHGEMKSPDPRVLSIFPKRIKIYRSWLETIGFFDCTTNAPAVFPLKEVVAFSGLASPSGFYETLRSLGATVVAERSFPDHHEFREGELRELRDTFPKVPLICTEKDAVKVGRFGIERVYYLRVKARISPKDAFFVQLERAILEQKTKPKTTA